MRVLKFKKLHPDAIIPAYAKPGDSGFDLRALEDVTINPGETVLVRTGLACELPKHHEPDMEWELQVRPRSGMSLNTQLMVRNAPGTVDNGYRGEVGVICYCLPKLRHSSNAGPNGPYVPVFEPVVIKKGDAIAQGVVCEVLRPCITEVEELSASERGDGGFGHTGK